MIDQQIKISETMTWVTSEPEPGSKLAAAGCILYLLTLAASAMMYLLMESTFYGLTTALMLLPVLALVADDLTADTWIEDELIAEFLKLSAAVCPVLLATMAVVYRTIC